MNQETLNELVDPGVLRHHNRTVRISNRKLRAHVRDLTDANDQMFTAVFDTETEAERALRELWESGMIECGPQDYDAIVEQCINALRVA